MKNEIVRPSVDLTIDVKLPEIAPIEHNLGVVKETISKLNEFYGSLVFTEEQVGEAEKELTKIRSLLKTMEDNRKNTIKTYKEPIDDFETTSKNIEKLLKESIEIIKSKIEVFKEEEIKEKEAKIKVIIADIYDAFLGENASFKDRIKIENIEFNQRWFNKTFKEADLRQEIAQQFLDLRDKLKQEDKDIQTIKDFLDVLKNDNLHEDVYITTYKYSKDLTFVLDKIKRDNENIKQVVKEEVDPFAQIVEENTMTKTFTGTKEQINQLITYAYTIGINNIK